MSLIGEGKKAVFFNEVVLDISTILQDRFPCSGAVGQYTLGSILLFSERKSMKLGWW